MMINPVSNQQMKSIPASIPASTPLKPSFRGNDEGDTVEIQGDSAAETDKAGEQKKINLSPEEISNKAQQVSESADAIADGVDKTVNSVTQATTKVTGAFTLIGATIAKMIPAPIKDFFATPVVKQVEKTFEENGVKVKKMVDALDKDGHKIYETIKNSDGVERVVRKFNARNTGIAVAVAAGIALTVGLVKHFKNKAKNAEKAQKA